MIVTAALPAAAVRLVRGAAGRHAVRAVQVLLVLGGLVVLGFVLGGQAYAAEQPAAGTPVGGVARTEPVEQLPETAEPVARRVAEPVAERVTRPVVTPVVTSVVTPVGSPGGAVVERVAKPVAEPVEQVVEGAVQGVAQAVPVPPLPEEPFPAQVWPSPTWPGDGDGLGLPVPAPGQGRPQDPAPAAVHRDDPLSDDSAADAPQYTSASVHTRTQLHPHVYVDGAHESYVTAGPRKPFGGRLPFLPGHAPAGPGGSAVVQSVGDGHTQRDGDPHGAWFSQAVAFGLVPGSVQPVTGTGVRERHRDILEFPG
ncbi:hypothetical protein [Streptomyces sp. NPDC002133]|uniref:hypothetical protein n=1 Tax=Streptomyces sp. NPDC002133 TaxID=3154409 RepID=UPI00332F6C3B